MGCGVVIEWRVLVAKGRGVWNKQKGKLWYGGRKKRVELAKAGERNVGQGAKR